MGNLITLVEFSLRFLPAAKAALSGLNPYLDPRFMSPPWALYLVIPLTPIPESIASLAWLALLIAATLLSLHLASTYFGMKPGWRRAAIVALLTISPFSLASIYSGQFTAFLLLGMVGGFVWRNVASPFFLLSLKPHLGAVPALALLMRYIREKRWMAFVGGAGFFALVAASSFLVIPGSWHFFNNAFSRYAYTLSPEFMTSTPELIQRLGFSPSQAAILYVPVALGLVALLLARPSLPMAATITLLAAPYARNYDYSLVLIPALYLIQQRMALPLVVLLLLFPFYRLFIGDLSWAWTDVVVPITFLVLLLFEGRRTRG